MLRPGLTAIVIVAMLAWAGHSLARLFWLFTTPQSSIAAELVLPATSATTSNGQLSASVDIDYLQENFRLSNGRGDAMQGPGDNEPQQAANTRLSLVLRGTVSGATATDSSAIIASGDLQRVYFVGDELQSTTPGVILDSVHPQYVVLNNNGRLESLWMYEPQTSVNTPVAGATLGSTAAMPVQQPPVAAINGRVQVRLYRENGAVRGLQIREDSDAAMLAAAGLQAGDIVTAVDGATVNQGSDLTAFTRELESRTQVDLQLIRNNNTMTVTVSRDAFAF